MGFDDGTPGAADAAGPGEGVRGETAEDVQEHVVVEAELQKPLPLPPSAFIVMARWLIVFSYMRGDRSIDRL
jgi:hypothetical protein